jgi:hypothetical protein
VIRRLESAQIDAGHRVQQRRSSETDMPNFPQPSEKKAKRGSMPSPDESSP